MKFLVDAQLPYGLKQFIESEGFDAIHTNDLPSKEKTTDKEILKFSELESRIVITKDKDFLDSFILANKPKKLIIVTSGNKPNKELFNGFKSNFSKICLLLENNNLIEFDLKHLHGY